MALLARLVFPCMLCVAGLAQAAAPQFEAAVFGAYRIGGEFDVDNPPAGAPGSADLEDGSGWGVGLALYRDDDSYYELLYSRQATEIDRNAPVVGSLEVTTEYYHLGGTLLFDPQPALRTWLSLTIGVTRFTANGYGAESEFSASLGAGLRMPLGERVALTLGLRGYLTFVDTDTRFFCSSIDGQGTCLLNSTGSTIFQAEASAGIAVRF
jgi:hypothetical protein